MNYSYSMFLLNLYTVIFPSTADVDFLLYH